MNRDIKKTVCVIFLLFTSLLAFSQDYNSFYKKDFSFENEVFRISAKNETDSFKFSLSYENQEKSFDLVDLNDDLVFHLKLSSAMQSVITADKASYNSINIVLNDSLKILKDSILVNRSYNVNDSLETTFKTIIDQLVGIKGCDSVFLNRPLMSFCMNKDSSDNVYKIFENFKEGCISNSKRLDEEKERELLDLSLKLIKEIRSKNRIVRDDASEAGSIMVRQKVHLWFNDTPKNKKEEKERELEKELKEAEKLWSASYKSDASTMKNYEKFKIGDDSVTLIEIDSVQFEFEDDQLKNVKAIAIYRDFPVIFTNSYPISFSTKSDGNAKIPLFSEGHGLNAVIYSNELFFYNFNLLNFTENYAPKNQTIYVKPNSTGTVVFKEKNTEILKTKVFTDFVGIDSNEPNGLLQLEFSKPISMNTKVKPMRKYSKNYKLWFGEIEPIFTLNKIENDDKQLPSIKSHDKPLVSFNDVLRYRKASLGTEVSFFKFGVPSLHSEFSFLSDLNFSLVDIGWQDTITTVVQTIVEPDSILNIQSDNITENKSTHLTRDVGLTFQWDIFPSDKYQLSLRYSYKFFKFYPKDELKPVIPFVKLNQLEDLSSINIDKLDVTEGYHTFQLLGTARLSKKSDLFIRGRYHFFDRNIRQQFFQIQFGYSYFFFASQN